MPWNCIEVTAVPPIVTLMLGSCDRSSRSHTRRSPPSARPMKRTPGRSGDHAPHESMHEANGETKSGESTPFRHRLNVQSPTERKMSCANGEPSSAVHGP